MREQQTRIGDRITTIMFSILLLVLGLSLAVAFTGCSDISKGNPLTVNADPNVSPAKEASRTGKTSKASSTFPSIGHTTTVNTTTVKACFWTVAWDATKSEDNQVFIQGSNVACVDPGVTAEMWLAFDDTKFCKIQTDIYKIVGETAPSGPTLSTLANYFWDAPGVYYTRECVAPPSTPEPPTVPPAPPTVPVPPVTPPTTPVPPTEPPAPPVPPVVPPVPPVPPTPPVPPVTPPPPTPPTAPPLPPVPPVCDATKGSGFYFFPGQTSWLATFPAGYPNPWFPSELPPVVLGFGGIPAGQYRISAITGDQYHLSDPDHSIYQRHEQVTFEFQPSGIVVGPTADVGDNDLTQFSQLGVVTFLQQQTGIAVRHAGPVMDLPADSVKPITVEWQKVCP